MKPKRQKTQGKSPGRGKRKPSVRRIVDELTAFVRQILQHPEFRIRRPSISPEVLEVIEADDIVPVTSGGRDPVLVQSISDKAIAEVATGFWYLKTKFFKREWGNEDTSDDDPRVRRAVARLNKALDALKESGIEVQDPTNKRYPPGSEGTMRPLQFDATPGLDHQRVSETVVPIIYLSGRIIQRGEVFVAVPEETVAVSLEQPSSLEQAEKEPHGAAIDNKEDTVTDATASVTPTGQLTPEPLPTRSDGTNPGTPLDRTTTSEDEEHPPEKFESQS